jgi:hypothetical protein
VNPLIQLTKQLHYFSSPQMKSLKLVVLAVTLCGFASMANADFMLVPGGPFVLAPGQTPQQLFTAKTRLEATNCGILPVIGARLVDGDIPPAYRLRQHSAPTH